MSTISTWPCSVRNQVLFMDPYLVHYPRENRNQCLSPVNRIGSLPDRAGRTSATTLAIFCAIRAKLSLANVSPRSSFCSTGYCVVQTPAAGAQYLAYAPAGGGFTIDLSAIREWPAAIHRAWRRTPANPYFWRRLQFDRI